MLLLWSLSSLSRFYVVGVEVRISHGECRSPYLEVHLSFSLPLQRRYKGARHDA